MGGMNPHALPILAGKVARHAFNLTEYQGHCVGSACVSAPLMSSNGAMSTVHIRIAQAATQQGFDQAFTLQIPEGGCVPLAPPSARVHPDRPPKAAPGTRRQSLCARQAHTLAPFTEMPATLWSYKSVAISAIKIMSTFPSQAFPTSGPGETRAGSMPISVASLRPGFCDGAKVLGKGLPEPRCVLTAALPTACPLHPVHATPGPLHCPPGTRRSSLRREDYSVTQF